MAVYSEKQLRIKTLVALLLAVEAVLISCLIIVTKPKAEPVEETPFYPTFEIKSETPSPIATPPATDVNAPVADVLPEYAVEPGRRVEARDLVLEVKDECPFTYIKITYETEPDWLNEGKYETAVVISDYAGNSSRYNVTINVEKNLPVITGLTPVSAIKGRSVAYKSGVKATDSNGELIKVIVDNTRVNRAQVGSYYAVYRATDSEGRTVYKRRVINIIEITDELVCELAQKVLDQIIPEGSTRDEQIYLVWKWSHEHISYIGSSDKSSILNGAYEAFTTKEGDCFTFFSANMYMYRLLGIEAVECHRVPAPTRHFWSLVKFSDGYWYYVDSCPHPVTLKEQTYKMSEADLKWFEDKYKRDTGTKLYYTYDKDFYDYSSLKIAQDLRDELKKAK